MALVSLDSVKNLYIGRLYYLSGFNGDGKPVYTVSARKYFFKKSVIDEKETYSEYFSGIRLPLLDSDYLEDFHNNTPRVINILPFSKVFPGVMGVDDTTLLILLNEMHRLETKNSIFIKVSLDYSSTLGARYIESGEYSAEDFRDNFLVPRLNRCLETNSNLIIDLDGGYGYTACFLEEAFGGLVRLGYDSHDLLSRIDIISKDEPRLKDDIIRYINEANKAKLEIIKKYQG